MRSSENVSIADQSGTAQVTRLELEQGGHPRPVSFLRRNTAHDPRADGIALATF